MYLEVYGEVYLGGEVAAEVNEVLGMMLGEEEEEVTDTADEVVGDIVDEVIFLLKLLSVDDEGLIAVSLGLRAVLNEGEGRGVLGGLGASLFLLLCSLIFLGRRAGLGCLLRAVGLFTEPMFSFCCLNCSRFMRQSAFGEFLGEQPPMVSPMEEKAWKY